MIGLQWKNLMEKKKNLKRLNGSLECDIVGSHAFLHEVSAFTLLYWLMSLWAENPKAKYI